MSILDSEDSQAPTFVKAAEDSSFVRRLDLVLRTGFRMGGMKQHSSPDVRSRPLRAARALLGVIVSAALALTACTSTISDESNSVPVTSLDRFYEQEIAFDPCEVPLPAVGSATVVEGECGSVEVPLDYADPSGDIGEIAVFRVAARGNEPIGSLLLNPGGPGFPGVEYAATAAVAWADNSVTERFDIVGFDPRGTGATIPAVDCFTDVEREADATAASQLTRPDSRPLVEACADSVGGVAVLAHLGTRDVVRDMDVIRAVLGDDKLTYLGASYGTRLGAVYAEMFPENVRALVLDGAMNPQTGTLERRKDQWTSMQRAFDDLAAFCIEQGDCPLGDDVEGATAAYQALVRPLQDQPVPAGDDRELTFVAAHDGLVTALYARAAWPSVIAGLAELAQGRGEILLAMRDLYHGRSADGSYDNAAEATSVINCLDEERFDGQGQVELVEAAFAAAPIFDTGRPVEGGPDWCEGWPVEPTLGYPYATDIEGLPETLTVSVTGDALTPHEGGISLAETLGGSLLTVEGDQHGATTTGNGCVDGVVAAYLIDLEPPSDDATCRL